MTSGKVQHAPRLLLSPRSGRRSFPRPSPDGFPGLTEREFRDFRELILRESGIHLSDAKKALLVGRLTKRLRELGLGDFTEYLQTVGESADELRVMLDHVSTNETHFFREPNHFTYLEEHVYPQWRSRAEAGTRSKHIRVWSAACSTGEEPYSLAMHLLTCFPPEAGWSIEIVGTDISTRVLERARAGTWRIEKAKEIPDDYLKTFMLKGQNGQAGRMKAGSAISSVVRFGRLNLNDPEYILPGNFDLIFCRNVMIYFRNETKKSVVKKLLRKLGPNGLLFVGHAENLGTLCEDVAAVAPTVYRRRDSMPLVPAETR